MDNKGNRNFDENFTEDETGRKELRFKNMLWTISGDYSLEKKPDASSFRHSEYIALYEAIHLGCFEKYFRSNLLEQYLYHVILMGAEPSVLLPLARLCIESAVWKKAVRERPGVEEIRRQAFSDMLEKESGRLSHTDWGMLEAGYLRYCLSGKTEDLKRQKYVESICKLQDTESTAEMIGTLDTVYCQAYEKGFADKFKGFGLHYELAGGGKEADPDKDGGDEERPDNPDDRIANLLADSASEDEEKKQKADGAPVILSDETMAQSKSYIERNYGVSYMTKQEQKHLMRKLCTGAHRERSLHFTEGLIEEAVSDAQNGIAMVSETSQLQYARRVAAENEAVLNDNAIVVRQNIISLADTLLRALSTRDDNEIFTSECGRLCISKLWNVGRTSNKKLFEREFIQEQTDFVVDVLIDSSGSQQARQSRVAISGYTISSALTLAGLPHRVMGFCTFGDFTVLRRYRDYDDMAERDLKILEFYGSANNRDGLAVRAAACDLLRRREENKILIILSDGVPNDIITGKSKSRDFIPYSKEYGVKDTAREVYLLRNKGIDVMGIFVGEEEALSAEKQIFGNDFAYIRDISGFSNIVGRYLRERIVG